MKLHDYIGNLVSSIQQARVSADLQAVRVAESYAKHELLEHFPVPRMRLKDVEMTIPIAIDMTQVQKTTNLEPIDNRDFNAAAYKEVLAALGKKSLSKDDSRRLRNVISEQSVLLEKELLIGGETQGLKNFALNVSKATIALQKENAATGVNTAAVNSNLDELSQRMATNLSGSIKPVNSQSVLEQLDVTIEADILKEKAPSSLVQIKLVIQEEGVEWHRMEAKNGTITRKLIPE